MLLFAPYPAYVARLRATRDAISDVATANILGIPLHREDLTGIAKNLEEMAAEPMMFTVNLGHRQLQMSYGDILSNSASS